jgi:hypothetical protein
MLYVYEHILPDWANCFTLDSFLKIEELVHIFVLLFHNHICTYVYVYVCINFDQKMGWCTICAFFHKHSSFHTATRVHLFK